MRLRDALQEDLNRLQRSCLQRQLHTVTRASGREIALGHLDLLNFASNDYLGLASHPALIEASHQAALAFGAGATASRLLCGTHSPHSQLETTLACFKSTEAALAFSCGYATALGVIPALVGPGDHVLLDRLSHACLVDGARLSGARLRVFRHNDVQDLQRLLRWSEAQHSASRRSSPNREGRTLIVTESVFSMDGDRAPLTAIADLKDQHSAWLLVDEAHATGLIGPRRQGLVEALHLTGRIEILLGTLGKAIGSAGGYVAGERVLVDFLIHRARSFIFSTAPPPGVAAAATAGIGLISLDEGAQRASALWKRVADLHHGLSVRGWRLGSPESAILPLPIGPEDQALLLAHALRDEGILAPAIRFPTVARGKARLRISLRADHTDEDIARLLQALDRAVARTGLTPGGTSDPS